MNNDTEGRIGRVLESMGGAHPREGMEADIAAHIAARVQIRLATGIASGVGQPAANVNWQPRLAWACAAGIVTAALLLGVAAENHRRHPAAVATLARHTSSLAMSAAAGSPAVSHAPGVRAPDTRGPDSRGPDSRLTQPRWTATSMQRHQPQEHALAVPARPPLSLEMEEMLAASKPAPEVPLTVQERLLQRMARRPDPGVLEALDPATRAAVAAREADEFESFFAEEDAPPPTDPSLN